MNTTTPAPDGAAAAFEEQFGRRVAARLTAGSLELPRALGERLRAARVNTEASADTAMLTDARYRGGIDSFLSSLDAQRSLYTARRAQIAVELEAVRNRVTLYRTLGGDSVTR